MRSIKEVLDSCGAIIDKLRFDYNTPAGKGILSLISEVKVLMDLIRKDFPEYAGLLEESVSKLVTNNGRINAYCYGAIRTAIRMLQIQNPVVSDLKIFISHSSKDTELVTSFVDHILRLGIGFSPEKDIFCSSIEEMGVRNGSDLREKIRENILRCDRVFFMISANYKNSEICLNEMGAAWIYGKNVHPFIFPDIDFNSIGWLYEVKKASKINNSNALDKLYDELTECYTFEKNVANWGRQKEIFLAKFS